MKNRNPKKPTIKEVVIVLNSLIQEIQSIKADLRTISGLVNMYIEFNNDSDNFEKHVDKQIKKDNNDVQRNAESSAASN